MGDCLLCERALHGDDAGRALCPDCEAATAGRLAALPRLYGDLQDFLVPGSPAPGPRPSRPAVGPSLPVSEPVLGIMGPGGMVGVLESWREALHQDRGWSEPRPHGRIEDRVARAAKALRDNVPWIAGSWPAAGAFAEEIRDAHRDALSIVAPPNRAERGTRLGNCPASVGGVVCGAVLKYFPGRLLECRWCGARYAPEQWLNLATWMRHDEQEAKAS